MKCSAPACSLGAQGPGSPSLCGRPMASHSSKGALASAPMAAARGDSSVPLGCRLGNQARWAGSAPQVPALPAAPPPRSSFPPAAPMGRTCPAARLAAFPPQHHPEPLQQSRRAGCHSNPTSHPWRQARGAPPLVGRSHVCSGVLMTDAGGKAISGLERSAQVTSVPELGVCFKPRIKEAGHPYKTQAG